MTAAIQSAQAAVAATASRRQVPAAASSHGSSFVQTRPCESAATALRAILWRLAASSRGRVRSMAAVYGLRSRPKLVHCAARLISTVVSKHCDRCAVSARSRFCALAASKTLALASKPPRPRSWRYRGTKRNGHRQFTTWALRGGPTDQRQDLAWIKYLTQIGKNRASASAGSIRRARSDLHQFPRAAKSRKAQDGSHSLRGPRQPDQGIATRA